MKKAIIFATLISTICGFVFVFDVAEATAQQSQQLTFEGKSLVVEVPDGGRKCSVTYGQNPVISNLDGSTPGDLTACVGGELYRPVAGKVTVPRNEVTGYWCFKGSKDAYAINFPFENGTRGYKLWFSKERTETPFINVKMFGAKGDGVTDDTDAIKNAIAFVAARQGATLYFPNGQFLVGGSGEFKGLGLPSGITILGASSLPQGGLHNYFEAKQYTQIKVARPNQRVFRIGECTSDVKVQNIALKADSNQGTYGIEAVGAGGGTPSTQMNFQDVSFEGFDIGFYAHNSDPKVATWQFDFVRVQHCYFIYNRTAGIWVDSYNTDWNISSSTFLLPSVSAASPSDGIKLARVGTIMIESCFGGGLGFTNQRGGDFLEVEVAGTLTVMNSGAERSTTSIKYGAAPYSGGRSYPLTLINNIFGDPIDLHSIIFVSMGNTYGAKTVQTDARTQIYSTGDRFCYDATQGFAPNENPPRYPCSGKTSDGSNGFQGAGKIVFQTGQPLDVSQQNPSIRVEARPTIIGTETRFDAPVQLAPFAFSKLPAAAPAGTMIFCTDCQKNSSPCKAGGTGTLAVSIGRQWDCK